MMKSRILVVEDEQPIADALVYNLQREGFEVQAVADGQAALTQCAAWRPEVMVLDLMIPPPDGLQVCRQVRADARLKETRILMLTAKDDETDEIVGFNLGADDYVAKPFRMKPLIERIKALTRRVSPEQESSDTIELDGLEIDRTNHMVKADGVELILTPTEFRLLWTLARQPGRTFSRNELLDCCRGEDANSMERTIDVHIRALRKKLEARAYLVETIRGIGYRCRPLRDAGTP